MNRDELKRQAGYYAAGFVESGMVVGLGTGTTAIHAVRRIAELLANKKLQKIIGIPSSTQIEKEAKSLGIPLSTLDEYPRIDITIDGADEVDPELELIKGGGGALLREKIIAQASEREIIVVDNSKRSQVLGTNWAIPIEVSPFGWITQATYIKDLGASVIQRRNASGELYRTDQHNMILDADFGPITDLYTLADKLNIRSGIIEHGLFLGLATDLVVASNDGVRHYQR